jgi:DNA polymerase delta, subunit 4
MLRQFDLSTDFGPCAGISRLQRWGCCAKISVQSVQILSCHLCRLYWRLTGCSMRSCILTHTLLMRRWNRAERLGLNPPAEIKQCLEEYGDMGESLWHNRL